MNIRDLMPLCLAFAWLHAAGAQTNTGAVRFVDGVAYYPERDPRWQTVKGEYYRPVPEGVIVREVVDPGRYVPPTRTEAQRLGAYAGPAASGSYVGRRYGRAFLLKNYK